jgi:AcrR family transcriptional regulator
MWRPDWAQRERSNAAQARLPRQHGAERAPVSAEDRGAGSGDPATPAPQSGGRRGADAGGQARGASERTRGRPRDPRADQAILKATTELLGEVGYARLTIEAIAARAQVGKTTIYRRWKSKGLLVVDLIASIVDLGPTPDTGDTRADLLAFMRAVVNSLRDPLVGQSIPGLANDLPADDELASAFRELIIGPKLERVTAIMARAIRRRDVPEDVDCVLVTDMLLGPILWRSMLTEQSLNDEALGQIIDPVLTGLRTGQDQPPES